MPKALVVGGSGFLGQHIVKQLLPTHEISIYDEKQPPAKTPGVSAIIGDIRDYEQLCKAMRGMELVVHCAAATPW